jgi:hypothetical protein
MKLIKKINEFEDSDLLDLMGDLGSIGFEERRGWVFQWDSEQDQPLVEYFITTDPRKALALYVEHGWFAEDVKWSEKWKNSTFRTLDDVFIYLKNEKLIYNSLLVYDLQPNEKYSKVDGWGRISNSNPFLVSKFLSETFTNAEERYNKLDKTTRSSRITTK